MPRVVVVTGASSGIGRGVALAFAERGDAVVLVARSDKVLDGVADACERAGGAALAVPADVGDEKAVAEVARRALERFGRIDVWVNNAAVMAYGRFTDTPAEVHHQVIETNLVGPMNGARTALEQFERQGSGVLVNVASLYGEMTSPLVSAYATSKFGLVGFSEVLRQELTGQPDIRVCVVLPGSVDTPIFRHAANYVGKAPRPVPPAIDPKRVIWAIVRCADRPRPAVTVGQTARVLSWCRKVAPRLYDRLAPRVMDRAGLGNRGRRTGSGQRVRAHAG